MKTLKQLIESENKANNAQDDKLRCFAINNFGSGQHAFAEPTNLKYFDAKYLRDCLLSCAASEKVTAMSRSRAAELAQELS